MRIGIFRGNTPGRNIDEFAAAAREAEADGFATYVLPQIFSLDAMSVFTAIAHEVPRIQFMTDVVPTYSRHPLTMAQQALTVQVASGGRFSLGIGLSHLFVIENMFGLSFEKPVRHIREYLSVLMPLLHDGKVSFKGETISTEVTVDVEPRIAPPVIVAALGEQMLRLAGTVPDGTTTWMTGPQTLADHIVPTITAAAEKAGRPTPQVIASLPLCVTNDVDTARERAAKDWQMYGYLPSYRAMLDREGAAAPEDVAIIGDEDTVGKALQRIADTGATEFVAAIFGRSDDQTRARDLLKSML